VGNKGERRAWAAVGAGTAILLAGACSIVVGILGALDGDLGYLGTAEGDDRYLLLFWAGVVLIAGCPIVVSRISDRTHWARRGFLGLVLGVLAAFISTPLTLVVSNILVPVIVGIAVSGAVVLRPPAAPVLAWRVGAIAIVLALIVLDDISNGVFGATYSLPVAYLIVLPAIAAADTLAARFSARGGNARTSRSSSAPSDVREAR
jgi:hypothetical protein